MNKAMYIVKWISPIPLDVSNLQLTRYYWMVKLFIDQSKFKKKITSLAIHTKVYKKMGLSLFSLSITKPIVIIFCDFINHHSFIWIVFCKIHFYIYTYKLSCKKTNCYFSFFYCNKIKKFCFIFGKMKINIWWWR